MKKLYTFTSDDIHTTIDYANGERNTINLEDAELMPEGARVLTRGQVSDLISRIVYRYDVNSNYYGCDDELDELFGDDE